MLKFMSFAMKYWRRYILCFFLLVCGVLVDSLIPQVVKVLIDDGIVAQKYEVALKLLVMMFSFYVLRGTFKYVQEFVSDTISQGVTHDIRDKVFKHAQKQGGAFFNRFNPTHIMTRARHDSENVGFSFGFCFFFAVEILFHVIVMSICIIRIDPLLATTVFIFMPIIGILTIAEERRGDKISDEISDETALMNKTASQALTGIRTVKAFGKEGKEKHRFANRNRYFFRLSVSLEDIFASFDSATWSLSRIMQAISILLGGVLVIKRGLTLGQLASYVEYVNSLVWPMLELGWLVSSFANSNASARKIKEVLDNYDEVVVKEPIQMLPKEDRTIEFEHVSLTIDGKAILKDINFKITKGKTLGIMGETGSGKSTIVNLLTRFLEPTSGVIRIGGVDITHLKTEDLRANISTVTQDIFLFSETIRENLTKGKQGKISEEEMIKLATLSDANSFITRLESNYDTVIGERGVGLSGGQKQRLCIARALLKNSPILALDDSTSALDMETEKEIQHSLKSLNPDWIKLIIAHRISAVRKAEEIIYLENGKIVERGTHDELMALKGRYYSTFIAQYSKEAINEC